MSRSDLLTKIERCVSMGGSSHVEEAQTAINRAWEFIHRYDVKPNELSSTVRRALAADTVAQALNMQRVMTRRGGLLGEGPDTWLVTGHGLVTRAVMMKIAADRGIVTAWEPA